MNKIKIGLEYLGRNIVTEYMTAAAMGSGDMSVLATPAMIALMENAAMEAVAASLDADETTVGSEINVRHLHPSIVGATIEIIAILIEIEGRKLKFEVKARDGENVIGEGYHIRYVVKREKFLAKLSLWL